MMTYDYKSNKYKIHWIYALQMNSTESQYTINYYKNPKNYKERESKRHTSSKLKHLAARIIIHHAPSIKP